MNKCKVISKTVPLKHGDAISFCLDGVIIKIGSYNAVENATNTRKRRANEIEALSAPSTTTPKRRLIEIETLSAPSTTAPKRQIIENEKSLAPSTKDKSEKSTETDEDTDESDEREEFKSSDTTINVSNKFNSFGVTYKIPLTKCPEMECDSKFKSILHVMRHLERSKMHKQQHNRVSHPSDNFVITFKNRSYIGLMCATCPVYHESCNIEQLMKEYEKLKTANQSFKQWTDNLKWKSYTVKLALQLNKKKTKCFSILEKWLMQGSQQKE